MLVQRLIYLVTRTVSQMETFGKTRNILNKPKPNMLLIKYVTNFPFPRVELKN